MKSCRIKADAATRSTSSVGQQYYTASSGTKSLDTGRCRRGALIRQDFINRALTPPTPAMTKALIMNAAR